MTSTTLPGTIGELRASGYQVIPVREEMRNNLITKIKAEEIVFPGIIGFEHLSLIHISEPTRPY